MEKIFAGIDHDMSGQIHFVEFVAALAEGADLVTMDRISDAFDRMDSEGKGYISHDDIKNILGKNYRKEVAEKMIEEGDFKKNGRIDYDEFVTLMLKDNIPEFGTEEDSMLSLSERSIDDHS
jgi:calcium-dependent protein kinase